MWGWVAPLMDSLSRSCGAETSEARSGVGVGALATSETGSWGEAPTRIASAMRSDLPRKRER